MYFDPGNVSVFARCETDQVYTFGKVSWGFVSRFLHLIVSRLVSRFQGRERVSS